MRIIGVLDSGIGGLSTCIAILKLIPSINILYYADNANAPYGIKKEDEVYCAVKKGVEFFVANKCEIIVLACNTATAVSIARLRKEYTLPIIGIEPAVKPAKLIKGNTLLLATPLTIKNKGTADFFTCDTVYLASVIEKVFANSLTIKNLVESFNLSKYENVILGCTHYAFLASAIKELHPMVNIFDGNDGVARQVRRKINNEIISFRKGNIFFHFSGRSELTKYVLATNKLE